MDREILGASGFKLSPGAEPLYRLLERAGMEIGTIKLKTVMPLLGSVAAANLSDDIRALCCSFDSEAEAEAFGRQRLAHEISPVTSREIGPVAVLSWKDGRAMMVFLGALCRPAPN